jgi:hypothetical protein
MEQRGKLRRKKVKRKWSILRKIKRLLKEKENVETCNQIWFACTVLVNVFVANLHAEWSWCLVQVVFVSGDRDPRSANLRITWRWLVIFTLRPFYSRSKIAGHLSDTRVDGTQSRSEPRGEEKNLSPCSAFSPDPFRSPVTMLTELYMLPSFIYFPESLSSEIKYTFYFISWNI